MDKDLDSLIESAFKIKYEDTDYPPSQEVWEEIIKRVRKQRKRDMFIRLKPTIAACVIFIAILGSIIGFRIPVTAFTNKVIKNIEEFAGNTFIIRKSRDKEMEDGHIKVYDNIEDPRINDVQNKISFKLLIPGYLPDGYKLERVDTSNLEVKQQAVIFQYFHENSEDKSKFITIVQEYIPEGTKMSTNFRIDPDTQIKHLKIKESDATLFIYTNGYINMVWDIADISYRIRGIIDEKTAIKIAESLK